MSRAKIFLWGALFAVLAVAWPLHAHAGSLHRGEVLEIGAEQEDVYAFGRKTIVHGPIDGDLIVFGRDVQVDGPVRGDVIIFAQTSRITGAIGGSLRIAAQSVDLGGPVKGDVLISARDFVTSEGAKVGRDLWMAVQRTSLTAPVGGEIRAAGDAITLQSSVGEGVHISGNSLVLGQTAHIGGALDYELKKSATIDPNAKVDGGVHPKIVEAKPGAFGAFLVITLIRVVIGLTALGLLLAFFSPRFARAAPLTIRDAPLKTLGVGVLVFFGVPALIVLTFIVGALIGGWWLGLLAMGAYAIALALCFPIVGIYLGELLLRRFGASGGRLAGALLLGVAILCVAGIVPLLGAIVVTATLFLGLGSQLLTGARLREPMVSGV